MSDLSIRRPATVGLLALAALVLGFGLWAALAQIDGAVVAPGRLEVERNRQVVQHPEGGVVAEILVGEGDRVAAGQLLLRLDGAALRSDLAIVEGQLSELEARTARLVAERDGASDPAFPDRLLRLAETLPEVAAQVDGQRRQFATRAALLAQDRRLLERRMDQIRQESNGLAAQRLAMQRQLDLIEQDRATQQVLMEKGLAQRSTLHALDREAARLEGEIGELTAGIARSGAQVTEVEIELQGQEAKRREAAVAELRQIEPAMLELAERRRALELRIAALDIRAPVAGIVLGLQVTTPRAVLRPAEAALTIVPQDRPLVVTARIPPIHVDEIAVGQPAEMVFPAFPARDTPHLTGRISRISADALTDPQTGAPFFTAEVELTDAERARLGDRSLLPGMPVEVYLETGRRSALAYLLHPFTAYFTRAFRES